MTKDIDKMSKNELRFELDTLRDDYRHLESIVEIIRILLKLPTYIELEQVKSKAEAVYKKSMDSWGFLFGLRDNIIKMAETLAEKREVEELKQENMLMFYGVYDTVPEIIDDIPFITDEMKNHCFEQEMEKRKGGAV